MKALELKFPPLPLAVGFGFLMWAIDRWLPTPTQHSVIRAALSLTILALALAVVVVAVLGFRKAKTTVDPFHPESASAIVTSGIYRFTRNPMYLGFLLALVALAVFLGNWLSALMPLVFVMYMNRFQIAPEERVLRAMFGASYEAYLRSVRRWI